MAMSVLGKRVTRKKFWPLLLETVPQTDAGGRAQVCSGDRDNSPKGTRQ